MLEDTSRNRPLKTEIWYPTQDTTGTNVAEDYPFKLPRTSQNAVIAPGKFPLILLSHGTGGNRISQMWLACELVGSGYIVASVDHFGNTLDNKIPENFVRIWDRPLDLSFLLDHLLSDSTWAISIDSNKIGMAGFSLGGYTGIALAGGEADFGLLRRFAETQQGASEFNVPELGDVSYLITRDLVNEGNRKSSDLKDERISAFAFMAPALGAAFRSKEQLASVQAPLLIIGAANDKRTPIENNARHYHQLVDHSEYHELEGEIGHYIFMNEARGWLKRDAKQIFMDANGVNRERIHERVSKKITVFFDEHLSQIDDMQLDENAIK
jgi:predicted dienelactone hydrolase